MAHESTENEGRYQFVNVACAKYIQTTPYFVIYAILGCRHVDDMARAAQGSGHA